MIEWGIWMTLLVAAVGAGWDLPGAEGAEMVLAQGGKSAYHIAVDMRATESESYAAQELQRFLEHISGVKLPVSRMPVAGPMIVVGRGRAQEQLGVKVDGAVLGEEGFVIKTVGPNLVLAGGRPRGTLYAVYELLGKWLGCRWYAAEGSPAVSRIPRLAKVALPPIDYQKVPVFECRDFEYREASWAHPDNKPRNHINGTLNSDLLPRHGGRVVHEPFVHSFFHWVPPDQYFSDHPEYYSLLHGQRTASGAQLCLTNPDVLALVIEGVRQHLRARPDVRIVSVSQNDGEGPCQCPNCQALVDQEGSQSGPVLYFLNQVADAIREEFPRVAIETLAYQYSRKPPRTLRPAPNVFVRLCSFECCFSHPLATCDAPANQAFRADLESWMQLTERLYVWDYATDFAHYYLPFPNLYSLGPNIRFYAEHHVKGLFEEGCLATGGSPFVELRAYLTARCLWEPECDWRAVIDEFMSAFYGKAAPYLTRMIDLFQQKVARNNIHVGIYAQMAAPQAYLPAGLVRQAERLCKQAEAAVAGDTVFALRVQKERLSVQYVKLMRQSEFYGSKQEALAEIDEFGRVGRQVGMAPSYLAEFDPQINELNVPRLKSAPTPDGRLGDAEWQQAEPFSLAATDGRSPLQEATEGRIGYDDRALYAVSPVDCLRPTPGWPWDNDIGGGKVPGCRCQNSAGQND